MSIFILEPNWPWCQNLVSIYLVPIYLVPIYLVPFYLVPIFGLVPNFGLVPHQLYLVPIFI